MKKPKLFNLIILSLCLLLPNLAWGDTHHTDSPSVTLKLTFFDQTYWQQMRFSNDNEDWSDPEAIATTKTGWDITAYGGGIGYGVKCVYLEVQDNDDNWSKPISACLIYDKPQSLPTPEEPAPPVKGKGCLGIF